MGGNDTMEEIATIETFLRLGVEDLSEERNQLFTLALLIERELEPADGEDTFSPAALDLIRVVRRITESAVGLIAMRSTLDALASRCAPKLSGDT